MKAASTAIIVLGLVLLGSSIFWSKISPKPAELPEEKEQEYLEAVGDMHNASPTVSEESKALVNEVSESSQKAERVEKVGATVLRYGGMLLTCLGVGLYFWSARSDA